MCKFIFIDNTITNPYKHLCKDGFFENLNCKVYNIYKTLNI